MVDDPGILMTSDELPEPVPTVFVVFPSTVMLAPDTVQVCPLASSVSLMTSLYVSPFAASNHVLAPLPSSSMNLPLCVSSPSDDIEDKGTMRIIATAMSVMIPVAFLFI